MSTRFEGAGAKDTYISIIQPGEEVGDDEIPEGQIAVAFNYDEVFYIQGTPKQVRELLEVALDRVKIEERHHE